MRHCKIGRKFNRTSSHRKLMFSNLMISLLKYGIIQTTLYKAKELAQIIEPIINKSKIDNLSNRRYVYNILRNKMIVNVLFYQSKIFFLNFNGGYTIIIKSGVRKGDNAPLAYIRLNLKNKYNNFWLRNNTINRKKNISL